MVHYSHSFNYDILRAILSYLSLEFNIMHWLPVWLSMVTRGYPSYINIYFDDVIDDVTGDVTKFVFVMFTKIFSYLLSYYSINLFNPN